MADEVTRELSDDELSDAASGSGERERPEPAPAALFDGTDRFDVQRLIGSGGMGAVYEAFDTERQERVALKTLLHVGPFELYIFKNEFRGLADIVHPNLVALHELLHHDDLWFFTMDFIQGVDLRHWIHGTEPGMEPTGPIQPYISESTMALPGESLGASVAMIPTLDVEEIEEEPEARALPPPAVGRLRRAVGQLAQGVRALHQVGKLHRDIKPSNVLVDAQGQVMLLDFGLVADLQTAVEESTRGSITGTVAYMSPEQTRGERLTEASDWYAVGCLLYEALTGRLPFTGKTAAIVHAKRRDSVPPPPQTLVPGLAPDLCALCEDLLHPDPSVRPTGAEVLERLGVEQDFNTTTGLQTTARFAALHAWRDEEGAALVGRGRQMDELAEAWGDVGAGRARAVFVRGRSGMGKSELLSWFLSDLGQRSELVVLLQGRCYEREWVPFKAIDPLVDALAEWLLGLTRPEVEAVLPRYVRALARVFPVLERVPAIAEKTSRSGEAPDPRELRRRAFGAFRELLTRMADARPLVLHVEDLQWADFDSVSLIEELLRPPDPPPLLLLCTYRSEDRATSPVLRELEELAESPAGGSVLFMDVGPLERDEAIELARLRLGRRRNRQELAEAIARESEGIPYFIDELVRYVRTNEVPEGGLQLDDLIRQRAAGLPDEARELLEFFAVAGQPIPLALAADVTGLASPGKAAVVLRVEQLARSLGADESIECYHDRIREAVLEGLPTERREDLHRLLADVLEAVGGIDPERLARHLLEAGERARARGYVALAAEAAARSLAFDRAAELHELCIELESDPEVKRTHRAAAADALANAGRGPRAARAYLQAAEGADEDAARRWTQRAATQLIRAGQIDEGREVVERVLASVGMKLASSAFQAILAFVIKRLQVTIRGLKFEPTAEDAVPEEQLDKVDVSWAASLGLSLIDPIQGATFQARNLLESLKAGEPYRVARSMAAESAYAAVFGGRGVARAARLLDTAEGLLAAVDNPHATGMVTLCRSVVDFQLGRWARCLELSQESARLFLDRCRDVGWEVGTSYIYVLTTQALLGELRGFARLQPTLVAEARDRGDLNAEVQFVLAPPVHPALLAGDPERAAVEIRAARARWPGEEFSLLDLYYRRLLIEVALVQGDAAALEEHGEGLWSELMKSTVKGVHVTTLFALDSRCRALLARWRLGSMPPGARKTIAAAIGTFRKAGHEWCRGHALALDAQLDLLGGGDSAPGLRAARVAYEEAGMGLHVAACRWALGGEQRDLAKSWFLQEDVADPAALVRAALPATAEPGPPSGS